MTLAAYSEPRTAACRPSTDFFQTSSIKTPIDLGDIGRVRVTRLDVHAGTAEVMFRSSETRALPSEFIELEDGVEFHEPVA